MVHFRLQTEFLHVRFVCRHCWQQFGAGRCWIRYNVPYEHWNDGPGKNPANRSKLIVRNRFRIGKTDHLSQTKPKYPGTTTISFSLWMPSTILSATSDDLRVGKNRERTSLNIPVDWMKYGQMTVVFTPFTPEIIKKNDCTGIQLFEVKLLCWVGYNFGALLKFRSLEGNS